MKNGKIIPLTFDYVFTSIFNDPNNIDIVENFLAAYFNEDIKNIKGKVKIKQRDLKLSNKKDGKKQVDLLLELNKEKINIELNNDLSKGRQDRNIVYISKIHGRQLPKGIKSYLNVTKTLQINLNNFSSNENSLRETYYLRNEQGKILTQKFQIDFIDLEKATKKIYNENEERLAKWCRAITSNNEEDFRKELGDDLMEKKTKEKLVDEVNKYSEDEDVVALYFDYTREELERNTIIEESKLAVEEAQRKLKEGMKEINRQKREIKKQKKVLKETEQNIKKEQENLKEAQQNIKKEQENLKEAQKEINKERNKIIKEMLKNNIDINLIQKYTGRSKEEIKRIKELD